MEQTAVPSFFSPVPFKTANICQKISVPENRRIVKPYVPFSCKYYLSRVLRAPFSGAGVLSWKGCTGSVNEDFSLETSFSRTIVSLARDQFSASNEVANSVHQLRKHQPHDGFIQDCGEGRGVILPSSTRSNGNKSSEFGESLLSISDSPNRIRNPETDGFLTSSAIYDSSSFQSNGSLVSSGLNGTPILEVNQNLLSGSEKTHPSVSSSNYESQGSQSYRGASSELSPSQETQPRRNRKYPTRQGKQITVDLDALKPGSVLPGKVTNIQPYGAFVDLGAFTSGLIHISNLSRTYVNRVEDIVTIGQEVKVEVLLVNVDMKRINLRLVTDEGPMEAQEEQNVDKSVSAQQSVSSFENRYVWKKKPEGSVESVSATQQVSNSENQFARKNKKKGNGDATPKPQKGEIIQGQVTKIVTNGVYVALKNDQEGYLPASEVLHGRGKVDTGTYFRIGQVIPVRVSRTTKDRIFLSMRKEKDAKTEEVLLKNDEGDHATSPFEIAFRRNKIIASYLEMRDKAGLDENNELS